MYVKFINSISDQCEWVSSFLTAHQYIIGHVIASDQQLAMWLFTIRDPLIHRPINNICTLSRDVALILAPRSQGVPALQTSAQFHLGHRSRSCLKLGPTGRCFSLVFVSWVSALVLSQLGRLHAHHCIHMFVETGIHILSIHAKNMWISSPQIFIHRPVHLWSNYLGSEVSSSTHKCAYPSSSLSTIFVLKISLKGYQVAIEH